MSQIPPRDFQTKLKKKNGVVERKVHKSNFLDIEVVCKMPLNIQ